MISISANKTYQFTRSLTGGYKGYDELGDDAYLRYYMSGAGSIVPSVASNTTQPASNGKFITLRGVDFAGIISGFPTFPNGNSTIIDQAVTNISKGISITGSAATFTNQRVIQNYLFPRKSLVDTIDFIEYNIPIIFNSPTNNTTFNNVVVTVTLKKVSQGGTITVLQTKTPVVTNKSPTNASITENLNDKFTSISGINDHDMLYIELDMKCDMTPINTSITPQFYVAHALNAQSYLILSI